MQAAPTQAESAAGSDSTDSRSRLVRPDIDRDIRALKLAVEEDLATETRLPSVHSGKRLGALMDFHIFTTHRSCSGDETPLHLISVDALAHYQRIEAEYRKLLVPCYLRRRRGSDNTRMTSQNASWPATSEARTRPR